MIIWVNFIILIIIVCEIVCFYNKFKNKFDKQEDLVRLLTFETKRLNEILIKLPSVLKINKEKE